MTCTSRSAGGSGEGRPAPCSGSSLRRLGTGGLALVLAASLFGCASADDQGSPGPQSAAAASAEPADGTTASGDGTPADGTTGDDSTADARDGGDGSGTEADPADVFRAAGSAEPGRPAVVEAGGTGEEKRTTAETVALDEPASPAEGLQVTVDSTEPVQAEGMGPGGMSGPAVAVVVTVHNTTDAPIETLGGTVTVAYGPDALPADPSLQAGDRPLPQVVAAGETVSGTYTFMVPEDQREDLVITASYRASDPAVVFTGGAGR
jgi:hypothetical protein